MIEFIVINVTICYLNLILQQLLSLELKLRACMHTHHPISQHKHVCIHLQENFKRKRKSEIYETIIYLLSKMPELYVLLTLSFILNIVHSINWFANANEKANRIDFRFYYFVLSVSFEWIGMFTIHNYTLKCIDNDRWFA